MTVATIFGTTADGEVDSHNAIYLTARAGSNLAANTTNANINVGQDDSLGAFYVYEGFIGFDTSSIGSGTVTAAVLSLYGSIDNTSSSWTFEARLDDWGAGVTTADYIAGASLTAKTLLASNAVPLSTVAYTDFTSEAAFPGAIVTGGFTRMVLDSSDTVAGNEPGAGVTDYMQIFSADQAGTTKDPKLTVTYTPSAGSANGNFLPFM